MNKCSININGVEIIATPTKGFTLLSDRSIFANQKEYEEYIRIEGSVKGRPRNKQISHKKLSKNPITNC